jgi:hypothetical protein
MSKNSQQMVATPYTHSFWDGRGSIRQFEYCGA